MYKTEEKQDNPHVVYKKRNVCHVASRQIRMLIQIDGIGPGVAMKLIDHFNSLQNVCNAGMKDLVEVPGIGKYLARKIEGITKNGKIEL